MSQYMLTVLEAYEEDTGNDTVLFIEKHKKANTYRGTFDGNFTMFNSYYTKLSNVRQNAYTALRVENPHLAYRCRPGTEFDLLRELRRLGFETKVSYKNGWDVQLSYKNQCKYLHDTLPLNKIIAKLLCKFNLWDCDNAVHQFFTDCH